MILTGVIVRYLAIPKTGICIREYLAARALSLALLWCHALARANESTRGCIDLRLGTLRDLGLASGLGARGGKHEDAQSK